MILVLLGTNPYPFHRLLGAVDQWAGNATVPVVAQTGHTPQTNYRNVDCHDFVSHEKVLEWIEQSELVISQGGFGSLKDSLAASKPVIACPRFEELGECQDSQRELVQALAEDGRVIELLDLAELPQAIEKARSFTAPETRASAVPDLVASLVRDFQRGNN